MVRRQRSVNNYSSTLNGAINDSVTTVEVDSATGLPSEGDYYLNIDEEIVLVTHISGTTLTVLRGQEGTAAVSHLDEATITDVITAGDITTRVNERMGIQALPYGRITRYVGGTLSILDASDFTVVGSNVFSQDGNDGTIVSQNRQLGGNDATGIVRQFDDSADWRIIAHIGVPGSDYESPDILHLSTRDGAAGNLRGLELTPRTDLSATFRTNAVSNPTKQVSLDTMGRSDFWARFEIRRDVSGSDDELRRYASKDGVNWWLVHTATYAMASSNWVGMWLTFQSGSSGVNARAHMFSWHEEQI